MEKIRSKKVKAVLILLSVVISACLIFVAQYTVPVAMNGHKFTEDALVNNNVGNLTELKLQKQGITDLEVLKLRRDSYVNDLNTSSNDNRTAIMAKIAIVGDAIAIYDDEQTTFNNSSGIRQVSSVSTNSKVNPNCTCINSVIIATPKCLSCVEYDAVKAEVMAIGVGFDVRGWALAADLIWHNLSNTDYDSDYWPSRGDSIIDAPQMAVIAQNNLLTESSNQSSPGSLSGIFESTIEGDMYNSLGSFYYSKKDGSNGNVSIDIIDRYDWAYEEDGGSADVFNNTLAKAQELGIVTPFYTRINVTMPGYVPFDWEYTDDGVAITGVADDITVAELPGNILDLRIKPKDYVSQPEVDITSIEANAFVNKTNLTQVILLEKVTKNESTQKPTKEPSKVSSIGNSAFSGCSNLTSISDLSNVTYIGDSAFENCVNLSSLNNLNNLEHVGSKAFYNCKELTSVTLPKLSYLGVSAFEECSKLKEVSFGANTALEIIGERAFCNTGLSNFTIPTNVTTIENEAFLGTTITSFVGNSNYVWQNGILIKCNVTNTDKKIAVYVNPTLTSISFPNNVAIISSSLFKGNSNINTINLNQVEHIGPDAFKNSSLTNIINANNLIDCDITALLDTPWYESNLSDFIILGKVMLKYRGAESIVKIPDNVERIGGNCFNNNVTTQVVLSEEINSLGVASFVGLESLESIVFTSNFPPLLDGNCFSDNIILYVKESRLTEYDNDISFITLPNTITKKQISIKFYDINNNLIGSRVEYYGSKLDNSVNAPIIKGEDFCGWQYNGIELKTNDMIEFYDDIELKAVYKKAEYQISIVGDDGEQKVIIEYGQKINLPIPSEKGKIFKGWFDQPEGGNLIINTTGTCVWERTIKNDTLYPQYNNKTYTVTYNFNNADKIFDMPDEFTVDNPITNAALLSPHKFGYVFKKWHLNNQVFTTTTGIFNDIKLVAEWEGKSIVGNPSLNITDVTAIVDMRSASINNNYTINIASSVSNVTFVGNSSKELKLKINISNRNKAIVIGFKSMKFKAYGNNSSNAINCDSNVMIYLTYFGSNNIKGGAGSNATGNGKNGGNGGYGVSVYSVTLMAFDNYSDIYIYGGDGGNGSNGYDGNNGKNGTKAPSGSMFKPVKGENGSDGLEGSRGGDGGNGGYAINVRSSLYISNYSNYYIKGGKGGNGGNGGNGGKGGSGADDTSANPFNGVGDPGDGGNGGNGGANGEAGQGSHGTNQNGLYTTSGNLGADGSIGRAGLAGKGGFHGTVGKDGKNGADGKGGSDGQLKVTSENSSLSFGQSQTESASISLPYAFSNEFFNLYLS